MRPTSTGAEKPKSGANVMGPRGSLRTMQEMVIFFLNFREFLGLILQGLWALKLFRAVAHTSSQLTAALLTTPHMNRRHGSELSSNVCFSADLTCLFTFFSSPF